MIASDYFVHMSSIIDSNVEIGYGTKIWHFCHVMPGARIGRQCTLGQNVFIGENVIIGDRVKIQNNVSIFEGVTIEDDVFIGPSVVFTNVLKPRSSASQKFERTLVKHDTTIGANATILCGITIFENVFVGAGSVVTKPIWANALVYGNPARVRGCYDPSS